MKKSSSVRALLGLTQEDMALLLKITRSQLSMYELGKRDLPLAAKLQLAEMLKHVQETVAKSGANLPHIKLQEVKKEKKVAELLLTNKYKQLVLDKKIKAIEKKYATYLAAMRLVGYLENQSLNPSTDSYRYEQAKQTPKQENQLLKGITARAVTEIDKNGLHILFEHEIKKELLLYEEKLLENFSKKL